MWINCFRDYRGMKQLIIKTKGKEDANTDKFSITSSHASLRPKLKPKELVDFRNANKTGWSCSLKWFFGSHPYLWNKTKSGMFRYLADLAINQGWSDLMQSCADLTCIVLVCKISIQTWRGGFSCLKDRMLDKFQTIKIAKRFFWLNTFLPKSKSKLTENVLNHWKIIKTITNCGLQPQFYSDNHQDYWGQNQKNFSVL